MKTIMLVCAAGVSTGMLVSNMQKAAKEKDIETDIFAVSPNEADGYLSTKEIDIVLLGPQVKFLKDQLKEKISSKNIPIEIIDMRDFEHMDGAAILDRALKLV
ncbi:PTS sugar transporter subunit IIB [Marinilactibacillus psychrotolerans]|uniref:PTS sugar transporter subunit IIB n=2 Tax=Marinilactibacillus psychrotolerans TaxID=191770 RepID=A0ABW8UMR7_9LACT|nr:PTS sugar transporter subunit IIB [Marinilactibacillus psychrotolerans]GEQ33784.1 cellobiose-specific PTS system IIB component [Marinilactibacillus psychrotolerans]SJN43810.1 PTS system, cellobiose-specific IIB component [Marinilactibacillus psychrotolerans 42ea]